MGRPQVLRELHLYGGGRVINALDDNGEVQPSLLDGARLIVPLRSFGSLYSDVTGIGLKILGCDFYHGGNDCNPPEWRSINAAGPTWLCNDQGQHWSFLANAAFQRKKGLLYDICSRISHQLRAGEWRLRQLSEAYSDHLHAQLRSGNFQVDRRFLDGHTSLCYLAFQAFLVEACVLRDYLAEYYAETTIRPQHSKIKIAAIKGLLKFWSSNPPQDAPGIEFKTATESGEWLSELGSYRNLVVHTAPLAHADKTLLTFSKATTLTTGQLLPAIKIPIPIEPGKIITQRSTGEYFSDPDLNFARLRNFIDDQSTTLDALEYAHSVLQKLGALSSLIASTSPFEPEIPVLAAQNLKIH